jgi:hypothetical protein
MLRGFRRVISVPAGILAVLLAVGVAVPSALHADATGDPCEVVGSGPAGPHLQSASARASSQHCFICHWLRSFRVFEGGAVHPLPGLAASVRPGVPAEAPATRLALPRLPARAPPE